MKPEFYNFNSSELEWFNRLIVSQPLGNNTGEKLRAQGNYNSSNMQVVLTINGIQIPIKEFDAFCNDYINRVAEAQMREHGFFEVQSYIEQQIKERLDAKLGLVRDLVMRDQTELEEMDNR